MKYSVGYQMREDSSFLESIINNKEHIHEIYFSWGDFVNSGCLNNCSVHVFHDNLVSHESEIAAMDNRCAFVELTY